MSIERESKICGCSSSGRAPPCQGGGSEFEPRQPLHFLKNHISACGCSSSGRAPPCQGGGSEFEPRQPLHFLKNHISACGCSSSGRAPPCQGGGSEFEPRQPLQKTKHRLSVDAFCFIRRIIFFYAEAHFFYAQAQINVFAGSCISDAEGEDMPHRERFLAAFGGPGVSVPTDRGIAAVWRRRKKGTGHQVWFPVPS